MMMDYSKTIDKTMNSAISLFYPIALMNRNPKLRSVYFDMENGTALVGFRRQVANFGVMLVRAQYGRHNEVNIGGYYHKVNGIYNYAQENEYIETNAGLEGEELNNGERLAVHHSVADEYINTIKESAELGYEVVLNPREINKFFTYNQSIFEKKARNFENFKLNMQFTAGIPRGNLIATAELAPGGNGVVLFAKVPTINGPKSIPVKVDRTSTIPSNKVIPGQIYLIEPVSNDKEKGEITVSVLSTYKRGIKMAVQHFNMGLIRPGDRAYSVNEERNNGITKRSTLYMPFMPQQNEKKIKGAPMITCDMDMFRALMKTLQGYNSVTLRFRDASSGFYFVAEGNEFQPRIEAIVGPTIQYVRGRIWLP